MRLAALACCLVLAGCAGGEEPDRDDMATLVVTIRTDGNLSTEAFTVDDGRLRPGELAEARVYARAGDEEPEEGVTYEELYLDRPGERVQRLTRDRNFDGSPQLLRDGRIAFISCTYPVGGGVPACALDVMDPKSGARETLLRDLGIVFHGELSPDESRFLFTRLAPSGGIVGLFVREVKGGAERRLVDGGGGAWSPDGSTIAFVSDRDRNGRCLFHDCFGYASELYVANADGSDERRLTKNPEVDGPPTWSGDGEWLVLGRIPDEDADWDLYAVRADGECEVQLTDTARWEIGAEWFGDGHGGLDC